MAGGLIGFSIFQIHCIKRVSCCTFFHQTSLVFTFFWWDMWGQTIEPIVSGSFLVCIAGVGIDVPTIGDFEHYQNKYLLEIKYPVLVG